MTTFAVDDVEPAAQPLETVPLATLYPDVIVLGGESTMPLLAPDGVHPLLSAVGLAFAEHRPLVLSPDAVWLTIAAGVAQHVRSHAETLRPRLVRHAGRERLEVIVDRSMPRDERSWRQIAAALAEQLASHVEEADLFDCDFSTSTDVDRMAARVVLLDAYSPYFSAWLCCVCGIASVTPTGTVEDWRRIRERVDRLATFGLDTWRRSLAAITDELVRAAAGNADIGFWRRIYNPADAYGGEVITGWAARFYPYLRGSAGLDQPNPLLDLPIDEPKELTVGRMGYVGPGVRSSAVPVTLSRVAVTVNDRVPTPASRKCVRRRCRRSTGRISSWRPGCATGKGPCCADRPWLLDQVSGGHLVVAPLAVMVCRSWSWCVVTGSGGVVVVVLALLGRVVVIRTVMVRVLVV